jgi:hypothetical protein
MDERWMNVQSMMDEKYMDGWMDDESILYE